MPGRKKYESRRTTPWESPGRTPSQEFIRKNYRDEYKKKHVSPGDTNEVELINSMVPPKCPFCGSPEITKKGRNEYGLQRYICKSCSKRFLPTTGTIFDEHKLAIKEWIDYTLMLLRYVSITADSWENRNSFSTSRYWLEKIFLVLEDYPSTIVLKGRVWVDETFYTLRSEDVQLNPDGSKPRGLSRNKMCIAVACDTHYALCILIGTGKPNQKAILEAFKDHIEPGSTVVHDEEGAHKKLIEALNLHSEAYNSQSLKGLPDKDNPLFRVNNVHARLKNFLDAHSGFMRSEMQNYLNLFMLDMNPPANKLEKVDILLNLAFQNPKTLRYREFYARKKGTSPQE